MNIKWNPQRSTINAINSLDKRKAFLALRNSSGAWIKNKSIRHEVFLRQGEKCKQCGSLIGIQIDHIVSVYSHYKNGTWEHDLNVIENLQPLCRICNASKLP